MVIKSNDGSTLPDNEWCDLQRRLHYFARRQLLRGGMSASCASETASDIRQEAIHKTISRARKWSGVLDDLEGHLFGTVKSLCSHHLERRRNLQRARDEMQTQAECRIQDPEVRASSHRKFEKIEQLRNAVKLVRERDPDLADQWLRIAKAIVKGADSDREVEDMLGLQKGQVYRIKKRFKKVYERQQRRKTTAKEETSL